jgi:hypothetical protein
MLPVYSALQFVTETLVFDAPCGSDKSEQLKMVANRYRIISAPSTANIVLLFAHGTGHRLFRFLLFSQDHN